MCATKRGLKAPPKRYSSGLLDRLYGQSILEARGLLAETLPGVSPMNSSAPQVERAVVRQLSYGKQLGALSDALADLVAVAGADLSHRPGIQNFLRMKHAIDVVKDDANRMPEWQQVLSMKVLGSEGLPNLEIFTLPNYMDEESSPPGIAEEPRRPQAGSNPLSKVPSAASEDELGATPTRRQRAMAREIEDLHRSMRADASLHVSSLQTEPAAVFGMLLRCLSSGNIDSKEQVEIDSSLVKFARSIYEEYQIPVVNSPLSGTTLLELANAVGPSASYVVSLAKPASAEHYVIGVAMVGGTRIFMGAVDGLSKGLKTSLEYWIKRAFRVPQKIERPAPPERAPETTRRKAPAKKKASASAKKASGAKDA